MHSMCQLMSSGPGSTWFQACLVNSRRLFSAARHPRWNRSRLSRCVAPLSLLVMKLLPLAPNHGGCGSRCLSAAFLNRLVLAGKQLAAVFVSIRDTLGPGAMIAFSSLVNPLLEDRRSLGKRPFLATIFDLEFLVERLLEL